MSLWVIATPIGVVEDLGLRARQTLSELDFLIVEERKPAIQLLKAHALKLPELRELNEHSNPADLKSLTELCRDAKVGLISDCGTPGFCDPGADLVQQCREEGIAVHSIPGPSSLMTFMSISGVKWREFYFLGFLPRDKTMREECWHRLAPYRVPVILMDTPYRLERCLAEAAHYTAERQMILGINLSTESEKIYIGKPHDLVQTVQGKHNFVMALMP